MNLLLSHAAHVLTSIPMPSPEAIDAFTNATLGRLLYAMWHVESAVSAVPLIGVIAATLGFVVSITAFFAYYALLFAVLTAAILVYAFLFWIGTQLDPSAVPAALALVAGAAC